MRQFIGGLDIYLFVPLIDDEIDFLLHILPFPPISDNSHINGIPLYDQLIIKDIFHDMARIKLPEVDTCITKTDIRVIILVRILKVMFPLHIPTLCFTDQKCVFQISQIIRDSVYADICLLNAV